MKYKLELIEDCEGVVYGAVIDENNEVVYLASGFQHYAPVEIDDAIREVSEAEEFDSYTWEDCIADPQESYDELLRSDQGYEVIYDGVYFFPDRMNGAGLEACGFVETGERKI